MKSIRSVSFSQGNYSRREFCLPIARRIKKGAKLFSTWHASRFYQKLFFFFANAAWSVIFRGWVLWNKQNTSTYKQIARNSIFSLSPSSLNPNLLFCCYFIANVRESGSLNTKQLNSITRNFVVWTIHKLTLVKNNS